VLLCRSAPTLFCRVRFGGCEPHAVAAYIGGVASQEAIKVRPPPSCCRCVTCRVTTGWRVDPFCTNSCVWATHVCVASTPPPAQIIVQQFRPLVNTHVYLGINGSAATLEL
jgi:hypothetical protein